MNNIYKVIWSKAKNCYVVASEIAKSHTKSASGQSVRRSALASLLALSLLCGGWGAASASLEVVDQSGTAGTVTIYTKDEVDKALEAKGAATDVASNTANIAANKDNINKLDTKKLDKEVANSTFATKDALNDLEDAVNNKVDESAVETALDGKADKADTLAGYGIKDAYTKGDVDNKLNEKADAANVFTKDQTYTRDQVNTKLADYAKTTDVNTALAGKANVGDSYTKAEADGQITTAKNELGDKITANTTKIDANKTAIDDLKTKAATTENTLTNLSGRMAAAESDIDGLQADMATAKSDIGTLKADVSTAKSDINSLKMKDTELTGKIEAEIANRITSDTALDHKIDAEIANRITSDTALDHKIDTEIQDRKDAIKATNDRTGGIARNLEGTQTTIEGIVKVDNQGNVKNVKNLGAETITTTGNAAIGGELGVTGATTLNGTLTAKGDATFKEKVTVEKDLTVNGKLNVGEIYLKNDKLESTGKKHDSATAITADGISNLAKVTDHGHTTESQFSHNEKGTINYAKDGDSTDWTETRSDVTADGVKTEAKDSKGNRTNTSQTASENKTYLEDKDGKNTNSTIDTAKGYDKTIKGENGETSTKQDELNITNTAQKGTIKNDAMNIENNATGDMTNTVGGKLTTTVGGNELHEVTGTKTENVTGKVTENYKAGQETNVTGDQDIYVTGKQTNKIDGDQVNTIGGDQTTTVTGDISNKAENITNEANTKLTDKVGDNTRVLDGEGITDTVGGSNLKSRVTQKKGSIETVVTDGTSFNHSRDIPVASTKTLTGYGKMNQLLDDLNSSTKTITDGTHKTSKVQTALDITNTAADGTITNDAKNIVNNASGDMTNTVGGKLTTTVTGATEENYNGGLTTNVTGEENHTVTGKQNNKVTGKQTNTVEGGQENIISGGQTNTITGGQINNITGDQTTTITGNKTETVTENVTEDYKKNLTTTVGGDEIHEVKGTKTETVEGKVIENFKGGQETNVTGNQDIYVTGKQTNKIDGDQVNTIGGNQTTTVTGDILNKAENITNEANTKLTDKVGDNTRVLDSEGITDTVPGAGGKGSTFKQRIDAIMGNVKTDAGESEVTQKGDEINSVVGKGEATNSRVTQKKGSLEAVVTDGTKVNKLQDDLDSSEKTITNGTYTTSKLQTALDITNIAKDGTITNDAKDIVNNASGNMTNTVGGDLKTTVSGNELHEVTGTKTENVTGKVTENYGNGQETNVTGDQYIHVTGKQTNKIDGDQENIIGRNQTTIVTGDISNKAENITNEANTKLTDKVGDHTRVLDSDGITDTVGGSTFKQRIDAIMMESKDVSIKAKETLTNEAKVITNKASEVINNEAVNINNTATGIITSKASEIKNQADKLISNKVGENTWENMENGKITTSIKDGAKQNLTQSDAAGTTQSTVDGGKSTVTIQNADGLADAVTDGRNTSVQNQTASAIAADVKDGAGNENASVATATTSANTIKSGSKANTVISTADGTSFINSEAAAPVGDGTEVKTTIKGNTITTGKVTMDYAEVMKDLGVGGNAKIDGKTTTGSLEVTGTSTLKGDVTMESNATVKKDLTVGGNATITGDVTARSYNVDGKTYIDANGINANNQKITNVADGSISEGSKDAVNGGQLYGVKRDLEHQVDKVGANAAAMANLRPMEFDPSSKWNIAAAIGNYGSETAAAIGAFYRPNDNVMVNLSTAFGTGENMVGGGVSVRLGKGGNKLSREETNALKAQVADLSARMDALLSVLNPNMSKDFPDVPENHWAYEAVSRLAGNDIVQGYPDGEFHGERTMTRYEMAEIIYNALSRGAEAERKLVEEFKPELQAMAASEKTTAEKAEG